MPARAAAFSAASRVVAASAANASADVAASSASFAFCDICTLVSASLATASAWSVLADAYGASLPGQPRRQVYSHSYSRFGQDQARLRLHQRLFDHSARGRAGAPIANPCAPKGWREVNDICLERAGAGCSRVAARAFDGGGDWAGCAAAATELLHLDYECTLAPCAALGVYQPSARNTTFVGSGAFWPLVVALGLPEAGADAWRGGIGEIERAGRRLAEKTWSASAPADAAGAESELAAKIFVAAHAAVLLRALGTGAPAQLVVGRAFHGYSLNWAVGAQLHFNSGGCGLAAHPTGPSASRGASSLAAGRLGWAAAAVAALAAATLAERRRVRRRRLV